MSKSSLLIFAGFAILGHGLSLLIDKSNTRILIETGLGFTASAIVYTKEKY